MAKVILITSREINKIPNDKVSRQQLTQTPKLDEQFFINGKTKNEQSLLKAVFHKLSEQKKSNMEIPAEYTFLKKIYWTDDDETRYMNTYDNLTNVSVALSAASDDIQNVRTTIALLLEKLYENGKHIANAMLKILYHKKDNNFIFFAHEYPSKISADAQAKFDYINALVSDVCNAENGLVITEDDDWYFLSHDLDWFNGKKAETTELKTTTDLYKLVNSGNNMDKLLSKILKKNNSKVYVFQHDTGTKTLYRKIKFDEKFDNNLIEKLLSTEDLTTLMSM